MTYALSVLDQSKNIDSSLEPLDEYLVIQPVSDETETRAGLILPASALNTVAVRTGIVPVIDGALDDNIAIFYAAWGFEPGSITVPVKVWHGGQDRFVARAHGRWLAEHIPCAEADLSDTDGHLTVAAERIGEVHEWLAGRL